MKLLLAVLCASALLSTSVAQLPDAMAEDCIVYEGSPDTSSSSSSSSPSHVKEFQHRVSMGVSPLTSMMAGELELASSSNSHTCRINFVAKVIVMSCTDDRGITRNSRTYKWPYIFAERDITELWLQVGDDGEGDTVLPPSTDLLLVWRRGKHRGHLVFPSSGLEPPVRLQWKAMKHMNYYFNCMTGCLYTRITKTQPGEHSVFLRQRETQLGEHSVVLRQGETQPGEHSVFLRPEDTQPGEHSVFLRPEDTQPGEHSVFLRPEDLQPGDPSVFLRQGDRETGEDSVFLSQGEPQPGEHSVILRPDERFLRLTLTYESKTRGQHVLNVTSDDLGPPRDLKNMTLVWNSQTGTTGLLMDGVPVGNLSRYSALSEAGTVVAKVREGYGFVAACDIRFQGVTRYPYPAVGDTPYDDLNTTTTTTTTTATTTTTTSKDSVARDSASRRDTASYSDASIKTVLGIVALVFLATTILFVVLYYHAVRKLQQMSQKPPTTTTRTSSSSTRSSSYRRKAPGSPPDVDEDCSTNSEVTMALSEAVVTPEPTPRSQGDTRSSKFVSTKDFVDLELV